MRVVSQMEAQIASLKEQLTSRAADGGQLTETKAEAGVQKQSSETAAAQDAHADRLERTIRHLDMENRKLKLKLDRAEQVSESLDLPCAK